MTFTHKFLPAACPWSQPYAHSLVIHHRLQTLLLTTERNLHVSIHSGQCKANGQHPMKQRDFLFSLNFCPTSFRRQQAARCLMSSASIQKLFCGICSAFKCTFVEFVGEKLVSPSYPSAILGMAPSSGFLFKKLFFFLLLNISSFPNLVLAEWSI